MLDDGKPFAALAVMSIYASVLLCVWALRKLYRLVPDVEIGL